MTNPMSLTKKQCYLLISISLAILSIPLIAMQFTTEVNWSVADFLVMGLMLLVFGILALVAFNKLPKQKLLSIALILSVFLWLWAEFAVGIFTNWGS